MTKLRVLVPIGLLVLASACNGDDGGSGLTEDQQAAVDQLSGVEEDEGIVLDDDCVEETAAQLSDEDAAAIAEAGPDGDPELSAEGQALTLGLMSCVDTDALVDRFIEEMDAAGQDFDEDCVRDALEGIDFGALVAVTEGGGDIEADPDTAAAMVAMLACLGG